ncbi:MAG: SDR family NAD(P)-dependent oxidoreductase [Alphaproteobacteria bacterium]|nr:SDR family NAD(P)-dependent oxidoreductase [Alphaproteobacteria bacterium]
MPAAIVTGGSSGIGAEICRRMLAAGFRVFSLDRAPCEARGGAFTAVTVDLTDATATAAAAARIVAETPISHIVHNAGIIRPALLADVTGEDLHILTQLHLGAPTLLVQAALPAMRAARFGRVVLLSSRAALGLQTRSAYSTTKAGMIALARTWALELAADGITVNCIAPGPIAGTAMFHDVVPAGSERQAALARAIPVQRLGTPGDVAHAAMFLADDASGFITGQTLFVCGGSSVGSLAI